MALDPEPGLGNNDWATFPDKVAIMLNDPTGHESPVVPGKPARKWASVGIEKNFSQKHLWAFAEQLHLPGNFARKVYAELEPGTLFMITSEPLRKDKRSGTNLAIVVAVNPTNEAPKKK